MNTKNLKLALFVFVCTAFLPQPATATSAVLINDRTAMFTIDFSIIAREEVHEIPITAQYGVSYYDRVNVLGYDLATDNQAFDGSDTIVSAVVLSDAPINRDELRYVIDPKNTEKLTLLIVATFTNDISDNVRARITKLPYFVAERRTTMHERQLAELPTPILEVE